MIRMINPTKVEPPATFLKREDVTIRKSMGTRLWRALNEIPQPWSQSSPQFDSDFIFKGVVDSICDSTILISGNIRTYLKEINHIGGSWPY